MTTSRGLRAGSALLTGATVLATLSVSAVAVPVGAVVHGAAADGGARQELRFLDPAIDESSGLLVQGGDVLTVNDSEGEPVVYVVDATTGATVGRTTYTSEAVDVEALAPGRDGEVWVGDIGDNDRVRSEVALYRIPSVERGDRTVAASRFALVYPGGPRDAEALLVDPVSGRIFVVTKGTFGGEVFEAPQPLRAAGVNRLRRVGTTGGLVTDGTFLPDGRSVLLRDYWEGSVVDPETWQDRGSFPLPPQQQGEGLALWSGGGSGTRVLVSSEGQGAPLWSAPVPARLVAGPEERDPEGQRSRDRQANDDRSMASRDPDGSTRVASDDASEPAIPLGPAVAGGALLVAVTVGGFWLLRRRVRR
jgi:hypothetical protein